MFSAFLMDTKMRVWPLRRVLIVLGLSVFALHEAHAQKENSWYPIETAVLTLRLSEFDAFVDQMEAFSSSEGLRMVGRPQQGSRNLQFSIAFSPKLFFRVSNFADRTRIQIGVYSEEVNHDWQPPWQRLVEQLRIKYGSERLTVEKLNRR
jgi:hypothetical protein